MHGCRLLGWIILTTALSGCEIGRTMFQMDSNSGRPFFGVDLLPARKKETTAVVPTKSPEAAVRQVTPVRNTSGIPAIATTSATPKPAPVKVPDPTLLERLK